MLQVPSQLQFAYTPMHWSMLSSPNMLMACLRFSDARLPNLQAAGLQVKLHVGGGRGIGVGLPQADRESLSTLQT